MTIEALDPNREPDGVLSLNGQPIAEYIEEPRLPSGGRKLIACEQHLENGEFGALTGDWIMGGCTFPGPENEQILRFQHVCPGPSIMKECRLRIEQYDADGKKIGGFADAWDELATALMPDQETRAKVGRLAKVTVAVGLGLTAITSLGYVYRRLNK